MPLLPPALDDRSFDDLVEEVLSRIPAHTPEWTNPRQGDPGRTLIELFAWLTDTLLYRANLIPERQRLSFLRLLGAQMRAAIAARGLVSLSIDDKQSSAAIYLQPLATLKGPVTFETQSEITLLPVVAEAYCKRPLSEEEEASLASVVEGLQQIYDIDGDTAPYVTTPVFADGVPEAGGFDIIERTVDGCLWFALLTVNLKPDEDFIKGVRQTLGENQNGGQQLINVGVMPAIRVPALFENIGTRAQVPHVWEVSSVNEKQEVEYSTLDEFDDTTAGLTRRGSVRLAMPAPNRISAPSNNVRERLDAGVGDQPPRLDVPETAARLVAWLRLRPTEDVRSMALSWAGINAVEIDQRQTVRGRVVGQSDGTADQQMQLPGQSIEPQTLQLEVEEPGLGYQLWRQVDDLAIETADARVYSLDSEAGTVQFGDGVRGRIPDAGRRVRVAMMRAGGGRAGNLPAGTLTAISARDLEGNLITDLKVLQPLPTEGGEDSESLDQAERRIPALLRHSNRAVTAEDYRRLAADTPGVRVGRVEVLRNFKPQQRRSDVPGVVSVMVLPMKDTVGPPNPRPDRPFLESVHSYLDQRRSLSTELYVIGCEYIQIGISIGLTIRDGFSTTAIGQQPQPSLRAGVGRDGVLNGVREALRRYLWPLSPGGADQTGWQLGRSVRDRELEVIVSQVAGVATVSKINLFERKDNEWRKVARPDACAPVEVRLEPWQLPELLSVVAVVGDAPENLLGSPNPFAGRSGVAVPLVPEVC